jgi:RecA/RadA recombinase
MAPPPSAPLAEREPRLAAALRDLGARVRRGAPPETASPRCPTGLAAVDRLLGGGFPRGGLSEIAGPPSSGRTSLVLALLATATARGEVAALVDAADAFDPPSAAAAGVALPRLLWVRPPGLGEALRSASHLLAARGFAVVVLDLAASVARVAAPLQVRGGRGTRGGGTLGAPEALGSRTWLRLRQATAGTDTALVVVADARLAEGSADLALDLAPASARFEGPAGPSDAPGAEGAFLTALESELRLVRDRRGGALRCTGARWPQRGAA